jgi:hypothetical protein
MIPVVLLFWGLWLLILVGIVHVMDGKTVFVLNKEGLHTAYTCHKYKRERQWNLARIRRFAKKAHRTKRGYYYSPRVVCQKGNYAGFSTTLATEKEVDDLCDYLNVFLGTLKAKENGVPVQCELPDAVTFAYNAPPQHIEPPPKCRWHFQTNFDNIGFQKRDWFRTTTWTFTRGEAEYRTVRFGRVRTVHHSLTGWNSLRVCLPAGEQIKSELIAEGRADAIRDHYNGSNLWQVAFLNANDEQLLAIEELSKLEALWIADLLGFRL